MQFNRNILYCKLSSNLKILSEVYHLIGTFCIVNKKLKGAIGTTTLFNRNILYCKFF